MSDKERKAQREYHEYAIKHLGHRPPISSLWTPPFDRSAYPEAPDELSALEMYLVETERWAKVLTEAAKLRQYHYEAFLRNNPHRKEKRGHKAYRESLNLVAEDAREKFAHFAALRDTLLDEVISEHERNQQIKRWKKPPLSAIRLIQDIQDEEEEEEEYDVVPELVRRPRLSKAEKNRRRKDRKKQKEAAETKALEEATEELNERKVAKYEAMTDLLAKANIRRLSKEQKDDVLAVVIKENITKEAGKWNAMHVVIPLEDKEEDGILVFNMIKAMLDPLFKETDFDSKFVKHRTQQLFGFLFWSLSSPYFSDQVFRALFQSVRKHRDMKKESLTLRTERTSVIVILGYLDMIQTYNETVERFKKQYPGREGARFVDWMDQLLPSGMYMFKRYVLVTMRRLFTVLSGSDQSKLDIIRFQRQFLYAFKTGPKLRDMTKRQRQFASETRRFWLRRKEEILKDHPIFLQLTTINDALAECRVCNQYTTTMCDQTHVPLCSSKCYYHYQILG